MSLSDDLLALTKNFEEWDRLKTHDKDFFESSSYEDVQKDIFKVQAQREITNTLININRIEHFLNSMVHLEKVLTTIKVPHTRKVMTYVWGPIRFLFKVNSHLWLLVPKEHEQS